MKLDLLDIFHKNKVDYKEVFSNLYFKNLDNLRKVDISVIIPVRGRLNFTEPVFRHLQRARKKSSLNISITYIEHSALPEHLRHSPESYIWIPCNTDSRFNKCLCFNVGVLKGNPASYYLFLDCDLLVPEDFFINLEKNLKPALQTFHGRRVLYANEKLSTKFIAGSFMDITTLGNHPDIVIGQPGAPGGSILISHELFFKVGGYDDMFFHGYSIEDQFFYDKVSLYDKVHSLDGTELVHLWHGESHAKTEDYHMKILNEFHAMGFNDRKAFVEIKAEYFKTLC